MTAVSAATPRYRLDRTPPSVPVPPRLDPAQQAVVDHPGGPLLVLAGPGTGKTTTLVEAVVERVRRGCSPEQVLVLTFSRRAADELRRRITGRLGRTVSSPSAWTFHSWCLALVSAFGGSAVPRLLSGPERLVRIRELLGGSAEGLGTTRWPPELHPALGTRGMAREVADLLDRVRERGLEPADLRRIAVASGRAEWASAAQFYAEYVAVLGSGGEMDYGELVRSARRLLDDPDVLAEVRGRYAAVFVDEYQDTDPAQEELLGLLAAGGDLVVVGDPDQAIYGFRGADVGCLLRFPDRFRAAGGRPAPTLTLRTSRRAGPGLLELSRVVATRIAAPGLPARRLAEHRGLAAAAGTDPGSAQLRLYSTAAEEATGIADALRRAHLELGLPWREMAVLVRSGVRSIPVLRRTLVAAGVPVAVAADEVPVSSDPAVAPLLLGLRCAAEPAALTDDAARALLTSPLVRATPADLRRLGRALRAAERTVLGAGAAEPDGAVAALRLPRPSATLVREAVVSPGDLLLVEDRAARPARRLAELLTAARAALAAGGAEQALWSLWERSGWPRRLSAASAAGGQPGRAADRDLDAVVALFDALGRLADHQPRAGVGVLLDELEAQEIPGSADREGRLADADAVRLLTAHRSKGLEWDLVVVAGVQDGGWPDLRRRGSLLAADALGRDGAVAPPTRAALLADERRLLYVALTRARRRLLITAVRSLEDDGERPSRFLDELGLAVPAANEAATELLSLSSLVGRLRRLTSDTTRPEPERRAAAAQLARLAAATTEAGAPLVPAAHPDRWWGLAEVTPGAAPVRPADQPVRLSGSTVSGYDSCPLAWFLEREARAAAPGTAAQGFGLVLHALARLVGTGAVPAEPLALLARLDEVWGSLGFDAVWQGDRERRHAEAALRRFLRWHAAGDRVHLGSEVGFEVELPVPAGTAVLRGSVDRLERDPDGQVVVVDFKTGRTKPAADQVAAHPQLAVYQLAVRAGGLDRLTGPEPRVGGAELVHLRLDARGGGPAVQRQPALEPGGDTWADQLVARTAVGILAEEFPARVNRRCGTCAFAAACPAQDAGVQVVR